MHESEKIRRRAERRSEEQMAKSRKRLHDKLEAIRRKKDRHNDDESTSYLPGTELSGDEVF